MTQGGRPGGLTALAVLNFVFGGFGLLGILGLVAVVALLGTVVDSGGEEEKAVIEAWQQAGSGVLIAVILLSLVQSALQIASGVGYLQQKKFLGRQLGSAYGVIGIVGTIAGAVLMPTEAGGGFQLGSIAGMLYPLVTLILLNTTFKHDFHR